MRREERRGRNLQKKSFSDKIIIYSAIGVAILTAILIGLLIYSKNLSDDVKNSTMSLEEMANMTNNTNTGNTESASTEIGKTVEEAENETSNTNTNTTSNTNSNTSINQTNTSTSNITSNMVNSNSNVANTNTENTTNTKTEEPEEVLELSFQMPVEGEITKEYARDNLVYSNTLEEWTTHLGVDIKADKTSVVKSAEAGTVKSIKNDPRYGLTIVIEHNKEYQTVYSNLLSSEFVVEGEKVEKGQSIGTVGNTAAFEIADEPHLHFEILKNSIQEDPTIYINN